MNRLTVVLCFGLTIVILLSLYAPSQRYPASRSYIQDLLANLEDLGTCSACLGGILAPLKALAELGDGAFTRLLVDFCVRLEIQPVDVCTGALRSQGPIIANNLRSTSLTGQTAATFCSRTFHLCDPGEIKAYTVPLIRLEPPVNLTKPVSRGRKPFKIVHISDLHIDRDYAEGSEAKCGRTQCCRASTSEAGVVPKKPARPYGERSCDAPNALFLSMLEAINRIAGDATMAILTGDIIDHAVWLSSQPDVIEGVTSAYALMTDRLAFPVYGTIGNHDTSPTNAFARKTSHTTATDWALALHAQAWRPHIGDAAADGVVAHSGSYSVTDPKTGVRIISINTGYAYANNFWLYDSDEWQPDPDGLLQWLAAELQGAEDRGQRAWIIGHMSGQGATKDWATYYQQVIYRYRQTIAVNFFGHSHRSEFELTYTNYSHRTLETAMIPALVGPGLTPSSGNPAFAVYDIDPDTFDVVDLRTYFSNFDAPSYQSGPRWWPYFDARRTYGPVLPGGPLRRDEPLDVRFWHRVTQLFERDHAYLQGYVERLTTGYKRYTCVGRCAVNTVCGLRSGVSYAFAGCAAQTRRLGPRIPMRHASVDEDEEAEAPREARLGEDALEALLKAYRKKARAALAETEAVYT